MKRDVNKSVDVLDRINAVFILIYLFTLYFKLTKKFKFFSQEKSYITVIVDTKQFRGLPY